MQYTQAEITWFQQQKATNQYTDEQLIAAIMQNREQQAQANQAQAAAAQATGVQTPAAQPTAVAQAVNQVVQPTDLSAFNEIADLAAEYEDHTEVNGGSLPAAGPCWIRFLNFIEIGTHASKNKTHKPSQIAIVTVELHSQAHMYEQDGVMVPRTLDIRIPKSQGQNSRWPKFVKAVQRALQPTIGKEITHMSQAIGHGCLGTIYHNKDGDKTYANLDVDKAWSFQPSTYLDPASQQTVSVNIPPLHGTPAVFMMNNQKLLSDPAKVKYMWDSIFVDGTYEKEVNGVKQEVSRNYYQKLIAKSIGWEQSPIKRILDSQGCTTTFGESAPAQANQAPAAQAAPQMAQAPAGVPQMAQAPQVAQAPQMAQVPQTNPQVAQAPAMSQMPQAVEQSPAVPPITGNASAGAAMGMPAPQTGTAQPAAMPSQGVASMPNVSAAPAGQVNGTGVPAQPAAAQGAPMMQDAAAFMNQFAN